MFFHEHKLIKPQRASFWQRLGPLPPQHTRPGPRVIAVTTLRAQAGQRPSPARPDSDHLPEISDLCWNGTCFRTIKDLPGMQPPGNHHLPVCRARSLLCQIHVISLPGSFPRPLSTDPVPSLCLPAEEKSRVGRRARVPSSFVLDKQLCSVCLLFGLLYKKNRYSG